MIKNSKFMDPEILIVKFGSEDIITSSPDQGNDPWVVDPFDD